MQNNQDGKTNNINSLNIFLSMLATIYSMMNRKQQESLYLSTKMAIKICVEIISPTSILPTILYVHTLV